MPVLPAEITARPGRLTLIKANAASRVCWHVCPACQSPDILPLADGKELVFVAAVAGKYELIAWSAGPDGPTEATHCTVKVESEEPPRPPDPLVAKLQAAWRDESDPQRQSRLHLLAGVYRIAADEIVMRESVERVGDLHVALRTAAKAVLADDALPRVRAVIADELRKVLPLDPDVVLEPTLRQKAAETFRRIGDALLLVSS